MPTDKLKDKRDPKKSPGQEKRLEDRKSQPQRESLKFHGDKLEHQKK